MKAKQFTLPTRKQFDLAKNILKERGWSEGCSMMHSDNDQNFGTSFHKNGKIFWLNLHTLWNLPD